MDTLTRTAVKNARRSKREQRREIARRLKQQRQRRQEAERQLKQHQREVARQQKKADAQLMADKLTALRHVNSLCAPAVEAKAATFGQTGVVVWVCRWKGPHDDGWCLLHGRKRVALIPIPGSRAGGKLGTRRYGDAARLLYLGSNGRIYRYGVSKVFEVNLLDRETPEDIEALVPNLEAMIS